MGREGAPTGSGAVQPGGTGRLGGPEVGARVREIENAYLPVSEVWERDLTVLSRG